MTDAATKITKNSFFRAIIEGTKLLSGIVLVVLLARLLGPGEYGRLTFALAIMTFFSVGVNLGLPLIFIRDGARNAAFLRSNLFLGIVLQSIATFLLFLVLILLLAVVDELRADSVLLMTALIYTALNVITNFFYSTFQAVQRMHLEALAVGAQNILLFLFVLLLLLINRSAETIIWGYVTSSFLSALIAIFLIRRYLFTWDLAFQWSTARRILEQSLPLMASLAFGVIYSSLDSIMLRFFQGNEAVGIYGAQYRVVFVFYIFAGWYVFSIFPLLSQLFHDARDAFLTLMKRSIEHMAGFGYLFGLTITLFATLLVRILYGDDYLAGVLTLQILIWSIMVALIGTILHYSLIAINLQKRVLQSMIISTTFNAILNFFFIPAWGPVGAAIATVAAQSLNLALNLFFLTRITPFHFLPLILKPTTLAGGAAALYLLLQPFSVYVAAGIAVLLFLIALFLTKVFAIAELKRWIAMILRKQRPHEIERMME